MKSLGTILLSAAIILGISAMMVSAQKSGFASRSIEQNVFKQLIRLPYYGVFDHIAYKVNGDAVTLFGKVAQARNKRDAEYAVKRIAGVKRVDNQIRVLPLSPFDDSIRHRTLRTVASKAGLFRYFQGANPAVRIIVDGGHMELEGYVANRFDYNLMNITANGISGVFSVKNNLVIENERVR